MIKKKRAKQKSKTAPLVAVALLIATILIGGLVIAKSSGSGDPTTLRDTDTAFSILTHVGQPAPAFTAINVDGQPYAVTPSDGRPKAIIFYMGFG